MVEAALGLGSNLGDRTGNLTGAIRALAGLEGVEIKALSSIWETPPRGVTDQPRFLNACVLLETSLSPMALLETCLAIEQAHGRERAVRWGARTLDIDLLWQGDSELVTDTLILPHPRITERDFVLAPLAEFAPDKVISGESVAAHLARHGTGELRRIGPFPDWR